MAGGGSARDLARQGLAGPGGDLKDLPAQRLTVGRGGGSKDPHDYDLVVNATPLGMNEGDPLPMDVDRIAPTTFVGEVVMKQTDHAFPAGRSGQGLPHPGRHRHAVRADSGLP